MVSNYRGHLGGGGNNPVPHLSSQSRGCIAGGLPAAADGDLTTDGYTHDGAGNQTSDPSAGTLAYNDAGQMISAGSGAESFSYAGSTQAEPLSDGSASGITYGLAGQDGQPWIQDYTATGSGEKVNVLHDQQGAILGEVNSNGTSSPQGDIMYVTDNLGSVVATVDSSGHGTLTDPYTP